MIGARGLKLLKEFEQCRLLAYDDGTGVMTLGWGSTKNVKPGDTCTQEEADEWLEEDLAEFAEAVDKYTVGTPLGEAQRDALIVLAYNIGKAAFSGSEVLQYVNKHAHFSAAKAFMNWTVAGGKPMRGLLRRRLAEAALYASDPWPEVHTELA